MHYITFLFSVNGITMVAETIVNIYYSSRAKKEALIKLGSRFIYVSIQYFTVSLQSIHSVELNCIFVLYSCCLFYGLIQYLYLEVNLLLFY